MMMSRTEENRAIVEFMNNLLTNFLKKPENAHLSNGNTLDGLINSYNSEILVDISKSLAVIADALYEKENDDSKM